jgi:surface antigen
MLTKNARRSVAALLLASAASIPLAGCDTIERETGFNRNTQMGAAGGAAFGGIIAALANANPAWIAASVILGGVTGGVIGDHLGKTDAEKHAQTNLHALSSLGAGQTSRWSDSQTGNIGSTTVNKVTRQADGSVCKSYTETVRTGSKTVSQDGTACQQADGSWKTQQS